MGWAEEAIAEREVEGEFGGSTLAGEPMLLFSC
jgi:hypothetical protein